VTFDELASLRREVIALRADPAADPSAVASRRERLILAVLPLARHAAGAQARFRPWLGDDLRSIYHVAACEAVDTWDPDRGTIGRWIGKKAYQYVTMAIAGSSALSFGAALMRRRTERWPADARAALLGARSTYRFDGTPDPREGRDVEMADARMDLGRRMAVLEARSPRGHALVVRAFGLGGRPAERLKDIAADLPMDEGYASETLGRALASLGCDLPFRTVTRATSMPVERPRRARHRRSPWAGVFWAEPMGKWQAFASIKAAGVPRRLVFLGYFAAEIRAAAAASAARARVARGEGPRALRTGGAQEVA
jgi:hypothetical protein